LSNTSNLIFEYNAGSDLRSSLQPVVTQIEDLIAKYPSTKDADAVETMIRAYTDVDAIDREHGLNLQYCCEGTIDRSQCVNPTETSSGRYLRRPSTLS
jgi:hypothetical protein